MIPVPFPTAVQPPPQQAWPPFKRDATGRVTEILTCELFAEAVTVIDPYTVTVFPLLDHVAESAVTLVTKFIPVTVGTYIPPVAVPPVEYAVQALCVLVHRYSVLSVVRNIHATVLLPIAGTTPVVSVYRMNRQLFAVLPVKA